MKFDGIIFDLDGTLWNSTKAICDTWNVVLARYPELNRRMTVEELYECMGLQMYDISAKLFPNLSKEMQKKLMDECCEYENEYLSIHGGELYEGLEEVLITLSAKCPLFIVSNCQDGYIECFLKAHNLSNYFVDTECWGRTRVSKGESNKILMNRNNLTHPVYVGDTVGDAQSAIDAGIPFVYAAYGFGSVHQYEYMINSIKELLTIKDFK